jgi:sugar O-acyltransferase (sialic acid O-acetyltransferase NeuD family)
MADVIIFGAGQIAEVIWHYLTHESDHRVVAFTVDGAYLKEDRVMGLPVVPFETVEDAFPPASHGIYVAMSFRGLNAPRAAKLAEAEAKGYRAIGHVSPHAVVPPGFVAKPNTFIMEHNTIQPFVEIGRNTIIWSGNHVGHHSKIGDDCFIASHVVISGAVTIGNNCFIGVNATLRDNISIGDRCIVGAGALVLHSAPDATVFPGKGTEPAKVTSDRIRL